MKKLHHFLLGCVFALGSGTSWASIETYTFANAQQAQDYQILIKELRCLVCQNQNLAESNAPLAQDLRKQTAVLLRDQNLNRQEVVDYMVQRYGDFVLYRPPLQGNTSLLWFGPLLLLVLGMIWVVRLIRQASQENTTDDQNPALIDEKPLKNAQK